MSDPTTPTGWETLLEFPGPPSSDDAFFTSQEDWWNNACLNWCHDGWSLYASGYKEAADLLVKGVEANGAGQDALVYPVLFLYRQYLELQLKDLVRQARRLLDKPGNFPKGHHIGNLWQACHSLLSEVSPSDSVAELKEIARLIGEFSALDPTSEAFRYPQDLNGNPTLPGMRYINLRNVREVVAKISFILGGAEAQIGEFLSIKHDMAGEFRGD
jgi:hypothetical protein